MAKHELKLTQVVDMMRLLQIIQMHLDQKCCQYFGIQSLRFQLISVFGFSLQNINDIHFGPLQIQTFQSLLGNNKQNDLGLSTQAHSFKPLDYVG